MNGWDPLENEDTIITLATGKMDRKTKTDIETGTGEGIMIGTGKGVEVEIDLETGVMVEGPAIVAGTRDHDDPNVYSTLYALIRLVLLNRVYF